jgi:hypothetical protein
VKQVDPAKGNELLGRMLRGKVALPDRPGFSESGRSP